MKILLLLLFLSVLFNLYIIAKFFIHPIDQWKSVSNFSVSPGDYFMLIHWIGGFLVNIIGPLQLIPNFRRYRKVHRWMGRIYLDVS
jgi:hypothetical protein